MRGQSLWKSDLETHARAVDLFLISLCSVYCFCFFCCFCFYFSLSLLTDMAKCKGISVTSHQKHLGMKSELLGFPNLCVSLTKKTARAITHGFRLWVMCIALFTS